MLEWAKEMGWCIGDDNNNDDDNDGDEICSYEFMNLRKSSSSLNLKTKLDSISFCSVDVLVEP